MSHLPTETYKFKPISLSTLQKTLNKNLKEFFDDVVVKVSDCPDFTQAPFNLASKGIGGGSTGILDLGGPGYLLPKIDRSKVYDLGKIIPNCAGNEKYPNGWYLSGAGAGPWQVEGTNCEMILNMKLGPNGQVLNNKTRVALTGNSHSATMKNLEPSESRCAVLGNYLVSSGVQGKVIEVKCSRRISPNVNFTTSIRQALQKDFPQTPIGLGGVFFIRNSQSKVFIMPDFSETPLSTNQDVNNWLNFFQMEPPMLFQSVLVSSDPGLDLRPEHSHGWSLSPGCEEGGHYDHDLMPYTVEYHGYFAVADTLWRVDRPMQKKRSSRRG